MTAGIKEQVEKCKAQINKLENKITTLQEQCQHENLRVTYGGRGGGDDEDYWKDLYCPDCGWRKTIF